MVALSSPIGRNERLFGWLADRDYFELGAPIGRDHPNRREDLIKVETILGNTGDYDLRQTDGPTGFWSPLKDQAIKGFQQRNGLKVDGLLKPGGPTITAMKGLAGGLLGGLVPPSPAEVDDHHDARRQGGNGLLNMRPPRLLLPRPEPANPPADLLQVLNGKTVEAMGRHRDWGDLPRYAAGDIEQNGLDFARDLLAQTHDRLGRDAADRLAHQILPHLPDRLRAELLGGPLPKQRPLGVPVAQLPDDDGVPLFRPVRLAAIAPVPQPHPPKPPIILSGGEDPDPSPPPKPQPRPQPAPMPPPPRPTPEPEPKPQPGPDDEGGPVIDAEPPNDDGRCRYLAANLANARLHYQQVAERWQKAADESNRLSAQLDAKVAERNAAISEAAGDAALKCAAGGAAGGRIPGPWPVKLTAAVLGCIRANIEPDKVHMAEKISRLSVEAGEIELKFKDADRVTKQAETEMRDAQAAVSVAQGELSQAGCDNRRDESK